jgi:aminoglycoside phosphotransferase
MLTLAQARASVDAEAARRRADEAVGGSGWEVVDVRQRSERLAPPRWLWVVHRVRLRRGVDETRELRMVGKVIFQRDSWERYRDEVVARFEALANEPLEGRGYPVVDDDAQTAFWFYPVDPVLHGLARAADPAWALDLFRRHRGDLLDGLSPASLEVERARYLPETSALLRYRVSLETGAAPRVLYGKVQQGYEARRAFDVLSAMWDLAQNSDGRLRVPRPRLCLEDAGLFLQDEVAGSEVGSDRTGADFIPAAAAAAEALAIIHEAGFETDETLEIEPELDRLDRVVEEMALVHPDGSRLLQDVVQRVRNRLAKEPEEELVATHGDLKYDQMVRGPEGFSVVDFEYFGLGETSWDLAKYCAHAIPSMPTKFEETVAADEARATFLRTYRLLRPDVALQRFPIHEATQLAGRAMVLMWSQATGWRDAADNLLILATERLGEAPP